MKRARRDDTDYERRGFVNLAATIVLLVYAIALTWTLLALGERERLERCIAAGRKDCVSLPALPGTVRLLPSRGP
jgi:hypothetical protein